MNLRDGYESFAYFLQKSHLMGQTCTSRPPRRLELEEAEELEAVTAEVVEAEASEAERAVGRSVETLAQIATGVRPASGEMAGGTSVLVQGHNFVDSDRLRCHFGDHPVRARWVSPTQVVCVSPPSPVQATSGAEPEGTSVRVLVSDTDDVTLTVGDDEAQVGTGDVGPRRESPGLNGLRGVLSPLRSPSWPIRQSQAV